MFQLFDQVVLLAGGTVAYCGSPLQGKTVLEKFLNNPNEKCVGRAADRVSDSIFFEEGRLVAGSGLGVFNPLSGGGHV